MTDDIDNTQSLTSPHSRTYQFCSRCGMVMTGVKCGFCKDLERKEVDVEVGERK
jgi:recombinational DNA repair protein RecR